MFSGFFGLIFGNDFFFGLERRMYRVMGQIQKEWMIAVVLYKADRFVAFTVGKIFSFASGLESWDIAIRIEVCWRLSAMTPADIVIESLFVRIPIVRAEVPFADMARGVPRGLEYFGNSDFV